MGTKKISELNETISLNNNDLIPVVDTENEATKKVTVGNLSGAVNGVDLFSSSNNYSIGDYCIYNNTLYKCIATVAAGNDFNDTKWDETTISTELKNKLTWNLLGEHSNTSDTMTTTQITISNINQYSEFLLTAANDTSTNRVLASSVIPKSIFAGTSPSGHHQAIYRGDSMFGSGVSFNTSTNTMTLYTRAHSAMRVYAR